MSIRWLTIAPRIGLGAAATARTANVPTLTAAHEVAMHHPRIACASLTAKASAAGDRIWRRSSYAAMRHNV
jgi:hypothetical protein